MYTSVQENMIFSDFLYIQDIRTDTGKHVRILVIYTLNKLVTASNGIYGT